MSYESYMLSLTPDLYCRELSSGDLVDASGNYTAGTATDGGGTHAGTPLVAVETNPAIVANPGRWIFYAGNCPSITGDLEMMAIVRLKATQVPANGSRIRIINHYIVSVDHTNYALGIIGSGGNGVFQVYHHYGSRTTEITTFTTAIPTDRAVLVFMSRNATAKTYDLRIVDCFGNVTTESQGYSNNTTAGTNTDLAIFGRTDSNLER